MEISLESVGERGRERGKKKKYGLGRINTLVYALEETENGVLYFVPFLAFEFFFYAIV